MRKLTLPLIALGIFLPALCGCESGNGPETAKPNEQYEINLDNTTRSAAYGLRDFYVQFTADAVKYGDSKDDIDNVIVSPLSAAMVLSMVANGVDADLRKEITEYLGVADLSALNALSNVLLKELPKVDNQADFSLSNSIWVNNQYKLTNAYTELLTTDYMADVKYEKFADEAKLLKKIGNWCSDKTDGQIKAMPADFSSSSLAIILNAMSFKGLWEENTFTKEDTEKQTFNGMLGANKVDMMHAPRMQGRYYAADDNFEYFKLSFGNTGFYMMVVLPNEDLSPSEANALLTSGEISKLQSEAVKCSLEVYMPKFKVYTKLELGDILSGKLSGLKNAISFNMFEPTETGAIELNQAACLEIDETGAKTAVVTSGDFVLTAPIVIPGGEYTVKVDRPFYFFIKESSTGACLLSGRISDL